VLTDILWCKIQCNYWVKIGCKSTALARVGDYAAIIPSIEGWAKIYGENTISVDPHDDPYWQGFLKLQYGEI